MRKSGGEIALVGDYSGEVPAHGAIPLALKLADSAVGFRWVGTEEVGRVDLGQFAGVWCVPGSPYRDTETVLSAIRFVREEGVPFLGTCGGFQHALIEIARDVLGIGNADHAETNAGGEALVITALACSLVEVAGDLRFKAGSRMARIYGGSAASESYRCRFGPNPDYVARFEGAGVVFSVRDAEGAARGMELEGHPFFMATLFQPERSALKADAGAHPLIRAFTEAVRARAAIAL